MSFSALFQPFFISCHFLFKFSFRFTFSLLYSPFRVGFKRSCTVSSVRWTADELHVAGGELFLRYALTSCTSEGCSVVLSYCEPFNSLQRQSPTHNTQHTHTNIREKPGPKFNPADLFHLQNSLLLCPQRFQCPKIHCQDWRSPPRPVIGLQMAAVCSRASYVFEDACSGCQTSFLSRRACCQAFFPP